MSETRYYPFFFFFERMKFCHNNIISKLTKFECIPPFPPKKTRVEQNQQNNPIHSPNKKKTTHTKPKKKKCIMCTCYRSIQYKLQECNISGLVMCLDIHQKAFNPWPLIFVAAWSRTFSCTSKRFLCRQVFRNYLAHLSCTLANFYLSSLQNARINVLKISILHTCNTLLNSQLSE